jgi:hypothetical protein
MSFWERMMRVLFRRREPEPEVRQARELSERIAHRADELNGHLQKYKRAGDPFGAMMADFYNRDQMSRLHRSTGP